MTRSHRPLIPTDALSNSLSTGKSIDQLLATVTQLVGKSATSLSKQPANLDFAVVRWDYDECAFHLTTIQQQPSRGRNPRLYPQPFLWPWIYIPAANAFAVVHSLNQQLRGKVVLTGITGGSLKSKDELADIVRKAGGVLIRNAPDGIRPDAKRHQLYIHTRREKQPIVRQRAQPQRYTRTMRQGQQLAQQATRSPTHSQPQPRRYRPLIRRQPATYSANPPATATPNSLIFVPGRVQRGETEEELRERVGLDTIATQICKAISSKWAKELEQEGAKQ